MIDWKLYLESICGQYAQWWGSYTITDVVGKNHVEHMPKSLLLDLRAHTIKAEAHKLERGLQPGAKEEREILNVLEGLQKYGSEHVLLVGRPGSGKSTALKRLLLEKAQKFQNKGNSDGEGEIEKKNSKENKTNLKKEHATINIDERNQIPVLVELRYYEISILDLITAFLHRHDPSLAIDAETIKTLLRQGQFFLLIDGVNELPSQEAQRNLQKFRHDYHQATPMIFTTRDLGVGGDLEIKEKLVMQPLTETQMREFVRGYLSETGEQMLQQLGGRLREFGETPLLLMMLCSVFASNGNQIPPNLGSVFRRFTEIYDSQLKQDIPVSDESRRWWKRLLQHLAWVMMGGNIAPPSTTSAEFLIAIPRHQAEEIFTEYLTGKVNCAADCAIKWLDDLLKHHLIQIGAENKIEFRHQLIQEYYAAERFLLEVGKLSDDELQWDYLNYLKWTEPTALMLGLVDDEGLALCVVRLALQVDWQLGARLAGEVKFEWQEKTVGLVESLNLPALLKVKLLGKTKSEKAISILINFLEYEYSISEDDDDLHPHYYVASALKIIKSKVAIPELIQLLKHNDSGVRDVAASALGEIKAEISIPELIKLLEDEDQLVRESANKALKEIKSQQVVYQLIEFLKSNDLSIRKNAISALRIIKSEEAIPHLLKLLEDKDLSVCRYAMLALIIIDLEGMIPRLIQLLDHEYLHLCETAVKAVGALKLERAIPKLVQLLEHENLDIRKSSIKSLGKCKSEEAISKLLQIIEDKDSSISTIAAETLIKINPEAAIVKLIQLLEHENLDICKTSIKALGEVKSEEAIPKLIQFIEHENLDIRETATKALLVIKSEATIPKLIQLLEHENLDVRKNAIILLGEFKAEAAIPKLIEFLEYEDLDVSKNTASALGQMELDKVINGILDALSNGYISNSKQIQFQQDVCLWCDEVDLLDESEVVYYRQYSIEEMFSDNRMRDLMKYFNEQNFLQSNNGQYALNALDELEKIQQHLKYYKPRPTPIMSNILSHNYALLIGVGECEEPKLSLPVTVKDIQAVKTLLTDENLCGYIDNDQHLRLLSNATATSENILDGLNWLKEQAENDPEATIFIYYSGHGCLDESGDYYLIPHETDRVDIPNTALPASKFNAALQQIPAKQLLVIIDSCHAQGMASSKEGASRPTLPKGFTQTTLPKNIIDELKQGTGRVVFTSSTGNQSSWVRPDGKMSVYTYHLLEALQGAANQRGDKAVRVSHLMNYLSKTVPTSARDLCKAEQTPFFDFATEDFPVALLCGGKGLATAGWDKQEAEEKIRSITNQVNNGVGNVGDRNIGINIVNAENITFGNLSSGG